MRLKRKQENRGSAWSHTLPHFSQICNFHDGDVLGPSVKISHHYAPQGHPFRSYPFQDSWSSMPSPVSIDMMRSTLGLPFMMLAPCIIGRKKNMLLVQDYNAWKLIACNARCLSLSSSRFSRSFNPKTTAPRTITVPRTAAPTQGTHSPGFK